MHVEARMPASRFLMAGVLWVPSLPITRLMSSTAGTLASMVCRIPPRQNSCCLHSSTSGVAMKDGLGSIRTDIQGQGGGAVAAAGERSNRPGCARSWGRHGHLGALARGCEVQARPRAGLDLGRPAWALCRFVWNATASPCRRKICATRSAAMVMAPPAGQPHGMTAAAQEGEHPQGADRQHPRGLAARQGSCGAVQGDGRACPDFCVRGIA